MCEGPEEALCTLGNNISCGTNKQLSVRGNPSNTYRLRRFFLKWPMAVILRRAAVGLVGIPDDQVVSLAGLNIIGAVSVVPTMHKNPSKLVVIFMSKLSVFWSATHPTDC